MYEKGQGVRQDYANAVKWYRKAAEQGYPKAQYDLGFMYANGRGVRRDPILAYMWFSLAATKGNASAVWGRDQMVRRMTAADVGKAQRLAREWWEKRQRR
jgi:TPR repeat protein